MPYKEVLMENMDSIEFSQKVIEVLQVVVKEASFYRQLDEMYPIQYV